MVSENSKIEFYKLHYNLQPDRHNLYILARSGTNDSLRVDNKFVEIVELLSKGKTIKEAAKTIHYSIDVVVTMMTMLEKANFVKRIDHVRYDKDKFTENSRIQFHKLKSSSQPDENDLYALVRWDTDDSLLVDKNVIETVELLSSGKTVKQAANAIGYSVDVVMTILKMLEDAHFFKTIDQMPLEDRVDKIKPWLTSINRKWFQWILYKPLVYLFLIISILGISVGLLLTGLPSYKAFFWTPDIFVVLVSLFLVEMVLLLLHESAHFFVTKAVGGEALMRISYRYIYLVAETESYHLALVPKKLRYFVYLAGSIVDIFVVGLMYWILIGAILLNWHIGIFYNFLIAVILSEIIGIVWQFDAFLETDMYNFLSDYLGIENLRSDALRFIDSRVKKTNKILFLPLKRLLLLFSREEFKNSDDFRLLNKTGKRKIHIYVVILILGLCFTTLEYFFYTIPRDVTFIFQGFKNVLLAVRSANLILFFKSITILLLVMYEYLMLFYLKAKEKK